MEMSAAIQYSPHGIREQIGCNIYIGQGETDTGQFCYQYSAVMIPFGAGRCCRWPIVVLRIYTNQIACCYLLRAPCQDGHLPSPKTEPCSGLTMPAQTALWRYRGLCVSLPSLALRCVSLPSLALRGAQSDVSGGGPLLTVWCEISTRP